MMHCNVFLHMRCMLFHLSCIVLASRSDRLSGHPHFTKPKVGASPFGFVVFSCHGFDPISVFADQLDEGINGF
jgi:hypothetical protein